MVLVVDLDSMDKCQVIDVLSKVRKQLRNIPPRLSMTLEAKRTADANMRKS